MQFNVGVIGATGYIGVPYRKEMRGAPEANIVALCARRPELLQAAAQQDEAALATDHWREVIDHQDVNLIVVATPDAMHYDQVLACAAAGKHVFCEKPVGMNAAEAHAMWDAIRQAGVAHYVPFWTRYVPVFQRAREIYQSGDLGEVKAVTYRWHNPRPLDMPFTWRDDAQLSSAGSIADVGSHAYDTIRWILGQDAVRVLTYAAVVTPAKADLGEINLEEALQWQQGSSASGVANFQGAKRQATAFDYADIAFCMNNGAVGSLVVSHAPFLRRGFAPDMEIHGTEASLSIDRPTGRLMIARPDGEPALLETVADPGFGNRFARFVFPALLAQIAGEADDLHPDLEDGYNVQRFTDAAAQSAREGAWVDV
jgi:predicted dehydrogenase